MKALMTGEKDRIPQPLCSVPDVSERQCREVEAEFFSFVVELVEASKSDEY